jgi:LacI family transcriptional regulator, gluconate utilization system Gnt-I transcriptional repressor
VSRGEERSSGLPRRIRARGAKAAKTKVGRFKTDGLTMQKIAKLAGVSAMTVSRALKSDASILPETRSRVLEIVSRIGYVPDATARMFASRRSGFIAALVPSLNNWNFAETVRGMSDVFGSAELQLLLGDTEYSLAKEERLVSAMLQRRPEAIVLTGGAHTSGTRRMLAKAGVPVVETWELPKAPLGHVVGFSNEEAGALMTRYLYDQGRRNIAFIGGVSSLDTRGAERQRGYARIIRELGLRPDRIVGFGGPPVSMSQGRQALGLLLAQWPEVDGVVCVSDLSAFGALSECLRRGVEVPQRLAVAGFGDFEIARCCYPRLTTIAIDCHAIGRRAAEIVLSALDAKKRGESLPAETVEMEIAIVERESA